jgi:hypothetical protein
VTNAKMGSYPFFGTDGPQYPKCEAPFDTTQRAYADDSLRPHCKWSRWFVLMTRLAASLPHDGIAPVSLNS